MPHSTPQDFIIVGITQSGTRFRPSDWADRLCSTMMAFAPQPHQGYSPFVQPGSWEGHKSVFVDARIHAIQPLAYQFLRHFARDNALQVRDWQRVPTSTRTAAPARPDQTR